MRDEQLLRYSRHILLPEMGIEGQSRVLQSRVLIVGAGGLGCAAALYLASSGVGHLTLVDDDHVDLTNLQRQIAHTTSRVGHPKVQSLRESILALNPDVSITCIQTRANQEQLLDWVKDIDLVVDACDNFATRQWINTACLSHQKPWVSAGAISAQAQITVFDPRIEDSPCYACLYPADTPPEEVSCASMGVVAPLVGMVGSIQALEALKVLGGWGESLVGRLMMIEAREMRVSEMKFKKQRQCKACCAQSH
jgi:molybdopterin/thiamine biosynthesis adenylyltransferase